MAEVQATPELLFDKTDHTYTTPDGVVLPSVTQILKELGFYPHSEFYTNESRQRGVDVHLACQYYDENDLDETTLRDEIRPYVEAYKRFRTESGFEPQLVEYRLYSKTYGYAGTMDRVGMLTSKTTIIDLKTGQPQCADALQTAAYAYAYTEMTGVKVMERYGLYLKDTGSYRLQNHKERSDLQIFLAAASLYQYKKSKGLI
ncbi:MAG: PD-(D/E)XK nuclease family protein [Nitrospirota bacterium]